MTEVVTRQSVWLFTREPESVRLTVQPGPAGFRLVIAGPGHASAEFTFTEAQNLERFREQYQQDLIARGFTAHASAERRAGTVSPETTRPATERRR